MLGAEYTLVILKCNRSYRRCRRATERREGAQVRYDTCAPGRIKPGNGQGKRRSIHVQRHGGSHL
jgi:hypothetical protein